MPFMDAAELLKSWRGERSFVDVAKLIDCSPSYVALLEKRRIIPGFDMRENIRRATKIPPALWSAVKVVTRKPGGDKKAGVAA